MGGMTELKILGVLLDIVFFILIIIMVVAFFNMANEIAKEREESPGPIPEHVYERLLNGDGYWE
jgi:biopolymer transport protein ExbD